MKRSVAILFDEDQRPGNNHPGQKPSRLVGHVPLGYRSVTTFTVFASRYSEKYHQQVKTICPPGAECLAHAELIDLHLGNTSGPVVRLRFPYEITGDTVKAMSGSVFIFRGSSGELLGYVTRTVFRTSLGRLRVVEFRMSDSPQFLPANAVESYDIPPLSFQFIHPQGPRSPKMSHRDLRGREPAR